jgi:AAA ATPase-like protein/putative AbiEii toxin of type IV toxin-antitoxin system
VGVEGIVRRNGVYTSVGIKNFRGIEKLTSGGFRRINVIVGRNNSGKTTFLEALFLLGGATNPVFPTTLGQMRGQRLGGTYPDPVWRPLFYNLNPRLPIEISARRVDDPAERLLRIGALDVSRYADILETSAAGSGGGIAAVTQEMVIGGLELRYIDANQLETVTSAIFDPKTGNINAQSKQRADFVRSTFLSARAYPTLIRDAEQYSVLVRTKQEDEVVKAVRVIEPGIQRIEVLSEPGGPSVYVDLGLESLVPLAVCGEGFVRFFSIVVEMTATRNGVLLIDEIDNGLHYSVMDPFWYHLGDLAERFDVQVFGTTHNEELVRSALQGFSAKSNALGLFRMDRRDGSHCMTSYDEEAIQAVLEEQFEVRG